MACYKSPRDSSLGVAKIAFGVVKGKAIPRDKATAAAHKLLGQLGVVLWRSELQEAIQERQHEKKGSIAYRGIRRTNTERYLFRLH